MPDKNQISVLVATAVGLAAIIGAGIFILSGTAIALAGRNALIAFVLVGIVALIVGFELSELGSLLPKVKGASYSYTYKAFGSELGFITGLLLYFSYATSISVVALGFGSYLASALGMTAYSFTLLFAIGLIFVLALVNISGIRKAAKADFVLVVIKIAILIIFVVFAFIMVTSAKQPFLANLSSVQPSSSGGLAALFAASVVIFFAYSGFQSISTFTSKIKGGSAGAAKAIIYSVVISIVLYFLVVLVMLLLLPASSYGISTDPLATALKNVSAPVWIFLLVTVGALIATASATLTDILGSSRTLYQMSMDGLLPKLTRVYNKKTDVATNGVIISAVIGIIMLFSGNIYVIAAISNFGLLFSYLMSSFAVLHFRSRKKAKPSFKTPFYPYLPIIAIVALMAFLIGLPKEALLIGMILIISLIIVYYTLREVGDKKVIRVRLFK